MKKSRFLSLLLMFLLLSSMTIAMEKDVSPAEEEKSAREVRLEAVRTYADNILEKGRHQAFPIFVDGLHVDTEEPAVWLNYEQEYVVSNFANQQNLLRILVGLGNLVGQDEYKEAASEAVRYYFDNLMTDSGLLPWGVYQFFDPASHQAVNRGDRWFPSDHMPVISDIVLPVTEGSDSTGYKNTDTADSSNITVMTYNIRYDLHRDGINAWPYRKDHVAEMIGPGYDADIIGIQEALRHQIDDLKERLPEYSWYGLDRSTGEHFGSDQFSPVFYKTDRFEILDQETFWLSETPDVPGSTAWGASIPRIVTSVLFRDRDNGATFRFLNTHFSHISSEARMESARMVAERISGFPDQLPVVFVGDLNFNESAEPYHYLAGFDNISDARYASLAGHFGPTASWNNWVSYTSTPDVRIDYIFVSDNIRVLTHRILEDRYDAFETYAHVLKNHFPFYDIMYETDPGATASMVSSMWDAHVTNWSILDFDYRGNWDSAANPSWQHAYDRPAPFYEGDGLTTIEAASDLVYAAVKLHLLDNQEMPLNWGIRLADMYVAARHTLTGLGAYQFSKPARLYSPPDSGPFTSYTDPWYGDRAENQFGTIYGDAAKEGWALWGERVKSIYVYHASMLMGLSEQLGPDGSELLSSALDGLYDFTDLAWRPNDNHFLPMWADGTDLNGQTFNSSGFYGKKSSTWEPVTADFDFLLTYLRAFSHSSEELFWQTARQIATNLGLGDIGSSAGVDVEVLIPDGEFDYARVIFTLLELYRMNDNGPQGVLYLEKAEEAADKLVQYHYHENWFLPGASHTHVRFNNIMPLALLALEAELRGEPERVPDYMISQMTLEGWYDGHGYTDENHVIWSLERDLTDLEPVHLTFPEHLSMTDNPPVFSWQTVLYATDYQFQITSTNFSRVENIFLDTTITGTEFDFPYALEPYDRYNWRVRALNDVAEGPWSSTYNFRPREPAATDILETPNTPQDFYLKDAYPNPFNPRTTIRYGLPVASYADIRLYDVTGREVAVLVSGVMPPGSHTAWFEPGNLSSGVYIYRFKATPLHRPGGKSYTETRTMTFLK